MTFVLRGAILHLAVLLLPLGLTQTDDIFLHLKTESLVLVNIPLSRQFHVCGVRF